MRFSERSDRRSPAIGRDALGRADEHTSIARQLLGLDADRIAMGSSVAAMHLALFYVLADPGDEVLVLPSADPIASDAATISGVDASSCGMVDAAALFDAATERTRAIVVGAADAELLELLAELDLPIVSTDRALALHPIFATDHAPLLVLVGESDRDAWLAVLGPADRAEPLITRLEWIANVLLARVGRT